VARPHSALLELARSGTLTEALSPSLLVSATEHRMRGLLFDAARADKYTAPSQTASSESPPSRTQPGEAVRPQRVPSGMVPSQTPPSQTTMLDDLAVDYLMAQHHQQLLIEALSVLQQRGGGDLALGVAKGLATAQQFYREPAVRTVGDIDLFLDPAVDADLEDILGQLGARPGDLHRVRPLLPSGRNFECAFAVGDIAIDMHRDIFNLVLPCRQQSEVWASTETHTVGAVHGIDITIRVLKLEHALIHAILNMMRDGFSLLQQMVDVRLMIEAEPDWDEITRFADTEGWTDMVAIGLHVSAEHLGLVTPFRTPSRRAVVIAERIWPTTDRLTGRAHLRGLGHRQSALALLSTRRHLELARRYSERLFPTDATLRRQYPQGEGSYAKRLVAWRQAQRAGMTTLPTQSVSMAGPPLAAAPAAPAAPGTKQMVPKPAGSDPAGSDPAGSNPAPLEPAPLEPAAALSGAEPETQLVTDLRDEVTLRRNSSCAGVELQNRVVLWNHENGASSSLNDMGAVIWQLLDRPMSVSILMSELDNLLERPMDVGQKATVRDFLRGLLAQEVLEATPVN